MKKLTNKNLIIVDCGEREDLTKFVSEFLNFVQEESQQNKENEKEKPQKS